MVCDKLEVEMNKEPDNLAVELTRLKDVAARRGLWRTMHAIDAATKALGAEEGEPMTKLAAFLKQKGACPEAVAWVNRRKFRTLQQAWEKCPPVCPGWMYWAIVTFGTDREESKLVLRQWAIRTPPTAAQIRAALPRPKLVKVN